MASVLPGDVEAGRADDERTRRRSLEKYRRRAARYDGTCGPTWGIRERTVAALDLKPGDRVLDVACGTGLSLALLRARVGKHGHVFGFDHSTEMLARAHERAARAGWRNVTLVESAAQTVTLPQPVDALLFHYTHDILRSPRALASVLDCARPGARVAIAGVKYFPWWLVPLNAWVYLKNQGYNGAPGGLRTPWDRIAPRLADWRWQSTQFGMGYIASGRLIAADHALAREPSVGTDAEVAHADCRTVDGAAHAAAPDAATANDMSQPAAAPLGVR